MRSVAFAVVALVAPLGACDTVFGLERDGVPGDASGDGAKPDANRGIVSFEVLGQPVNVGEMKLVKARLFDKPDTMATWTMSATNGMIDQPNGSVKLDAIGVGDLESAWRAPSTPGQVRLHLEAVGDAEDLVVNVGMPATWGNDSTGTKAFVLAGDSVYGSRIMISQGGSVLTLGVWIDAGNGTHGRLALYTDASGVPALKLAETASTLLRDQRNELPITSGSSLAPGAYWVVLAIDATTSVRFSAGASYVGKAALYAAGFPPAFGAGFTATPGDQLQVFATLSQ